VPTKMRKFLPLLLCLSLSIFTVARATKPAHVFAPEPDAKALVNDAKIGEEAASDDDEGTTGGSNDDGEDVNNDDGDGAAGDEGTGADDGADDDGDDDGSGNQGE
jgi:hypothetical protein